MSYKFYRLALLAFVSVLLPGMKAGAQTVYGNEWIDYSKTYIKLKVGQAVTGTTIKDGIYRVSKGGLDAAGVPAGTPGTAFSLWREGQEVPLFVSTNGTFGNGDYIEFFGLRPNGKLDKELYGNAPQADDGVSLFTDTAAYFLTYDNGSNHQRYVQAANNIPATPPSPEGYCWAHARVDYRGNWLAGRSENSGDLFYSSQFTEAEGYIKAYAAPPGTQAASLATPGLTNIGLNATVDLTVLAQAIFDAHDFKLKLNGTEIADSSFGNYATKRYVVPAFTNLLLATGNNSVLIEPQGAAGTGQNYYGISYADIRYTRSFALNNVSYFQFSLDANSNPQYLEITGFTNAANSPRLYDLTNKKYYTGDITVAGMIRYYLDPSATDRDLVMFSENNTTNLSTLIPAKTFQFTDYTNPAHQGNYVVISHKDLEQLTNGHNYVQDVADYRASATGGSFTTVVADVQELYDQFAYGYDMHPLAIKHLLQYGYDHWATKPQYTFLIGRGLLYYQSRSYYANPSQYPFPIVPTYGHPGSDVDLVNFGTDLKHQRILIGRLSVWNAQEIGDYLDKMKGYEEALKPAMMPTAATELWKKQVLHIAGGSDPILQLYTLIPTLDTGKTIIEAPCAGKVVTTIAKSTTATVDQINNAKVDSLIQSGLSIITFHGHASAGTFDYNLNNPEQYHSAPRLPFFLALGCDVAQMFELGTSKTITERYVLSKTAGAIEMLAADNTGYTSFHPQYLDTLYSQIATRNYGQTLGRQYQATYDGMMTNYNSFNFTHLESMLLVGDPAVSIFSPQLPDFHVAESGLSTIPGYVTSSMDSFKLQVSAFNLGKSGCGVPDTVLVKVEHVNPAGTTTTVRTYPVTGLLISDTALINIPIDRAADVGLNTYRVTIDPNNAILESSELNNVAEIQVFISTDRVFPVYPKEFDIVYQQGVTLKASTLNPFRPMGHFLMEIDTTELFNSPLHQSTQITSKGGVLKWTPNITMTDSTVYYWRTAVDSVVNGSPEWTSSSFVYLANGSPGWNQSHFYQWEKDAFYQLQIGADRKFIFPAGTNKLDVHNAVMYTNSDGTYTNIFLNEALKQSSVQDFNGVIQVMVIDSVSGDPVTNTSTLYHGSAPPAAGTTVRGTYVSEFALGSATERLRAAHYIDSIPNGDYVMIRNVIWSPSWTATNARYVDTLQADASLDPINLYSVLHAMGFGLIDSFTSKRAFVFFRRKGDASYPVFQQINSGAQNDTIAHTFYITSYPDTGSMTSTIIGPAAQWQSLKWKTFPLDGKAQNDHPGVKVTGITPSGAFVPLFTTSNTDTSIAGISAQQFPNIRMEWLSSDSTNRTSTQQRFWRVLYTPVPEAALNPNAYFTIIDSVSAGQPEVFGVAIENLTSIPMDSMLVRYRVLNNGGSPQDLRSVRYRPLPGNDTLHAMLSFLPDAYPGRNLLFIEANPNNDQPEQYHPNNLGYVPFRVSSDALNPLLDVTFDGVHILNRDIVSAKPFIKVLLRDENRYLALDDTSLLTMSLRYPGEPAGTTHPIPFDGTVSKFIPAQTGSNKNEAAIEFRPTLNTDGIYELTVNGKDKSGNKVSSASYSVEFEVVNKSTITNVLNYPNPFSTSTAFVFTLTGAQLPSQFKIQILSVTGKVVREITRQEIGPLHIGRNITDYRWDGKDQYGQMLGNGVYLYRVVTAMNGEDMERRNDTSVDKFFKNGYGKMYIMR